MVSKKVTFNSVVLSWIIFVIVVSIANAENTDASLSVSAEISKSYYGAYRLGLVATVHNVTVSGRLANTTNDFGIPSQSISIYYKKVSRSARPYEPSQPLYDSDWLFVDNTSTDADGYYSYVWIPPTTDFMWPEEHEVVYQVKVVWECDDLSLMDFRDIYISSLEYEPPPQEASIIHTLQPFLITGLILSGATAFAIVIFNSFSEIRERTRFDKKTALYSLLSLFLLFAIFWLPYFIPYLAVFSFLMILAIPIILIISISCFFGYLEKGNKLKTILSFVISAWSGLLVLLGASVLFKMYWLPSLFFSYVPVWQYYSGIYMLFMYFSAPILALLLILFSLKEERTVSSA